MMVPVSMIAMLLSLGLVGQAPEAPPEHSGEWVVIESKESQVSFAMPARPDERTKDVATPAGKVTMRVYACYAGKKTLMLHFETLPRPVPEGQALDAVETTIKSRLPGQFRLISERRITRGNVAGKEVIFTMSYAEGVCTYKTHFYVRPEKIYMLIATGGPGAPIPPESDAFLDSVRFDGRPAVRPVMAKAKAMTKAAVTPRPALVPARRKQIGQIDRVDTTSEGAFRTFLMAMAAGDETTLREITLPNPDLDWLLRDDGTPTLGIRELKQQILKKRVERLREGDRVKLPGNQVHVIRPTEVGRDSAALRVEGMPSYAPLQRIKGRWKVDPAPLIAARKAAEAAKQAPRK